MQRICSLRGQIKIPLFEHRIILSLIFTTIYLINCSNDVTKINDENITSEKPVADVISVLVNGDPQPNGCAF